MNNGKLIAVDLAKSVFQVCQLSADNKVVVNNSDGQCHINCADSIFGSDSTRYSGSDSS